MNLGRILPLLVSILLLVAWESAVVLFNISEYLLPPPSQIISRLVQGHITLISHVLVTATEAVLGFALAAVCGVVLATVFVHSRTLEAGLYPYTIALKSMPMVAVAPLLIVWLGNGLAPKILIAALISFFPVVVNTTKGFRSIDAEALDLFESLSASKTQVFLKLRAPSAIPYFFASLKVAATLSVVGAIVGEFAGADRGLGFFILISSHRLNTVDMFVGIVLASLLGIVLFYLVAVAERILAPWSPGISLAG